MKFIVAGDLHYRTVNPRGRLDVYQDSITTKLIEVFDIAKQHDAEAIIIPGDIFDSPGVGLGTIAELGSVIRENKSCPVLCVPGNHDLWGANTTSKPRTPFGLLGRFELIEDLNEINWDFHSGNENVFVTGHGYDTDTDTEAGINQFEPGGGAVDGCSIHVVHSMLLENSPGFQMRHTLIQDIETSANVIISGHEHLGFGIKRREDGVLFINPGALCRLAAHPAEMERQVQVAVLEVENGEADAYLVPLQSAQPGREVLSREHLELQAAREERTAEFLHLLQETGETKFLDITEIIQGIAKRDKLPKIIRDTALGRLAAAKEECASK